VDTCLREVEEKVTVMRFDGIETHANASIVNTGTGGERKSPAVQRAIQYLPGDETAFECSALMGADVADSVKPPFDIEYQHLFIVVYFYDASRS
jgi:hypothetical protein